jgi:DNA-binding transcriptional LysR family regulator
MMNLVGMGIFARVAEAKSFSAAGCRPGISKSLVSKKVSKLEKPLGARLRVVQEAEEAALLIDRLHAKPRGVLKCTAPVAFATLHIASALPGFVSSCPDVQVDLTVGGRFFELAEEGYDLAIRIARELSPT